MSSERDPREVRDERTFEEIGAKKSPVKSTLRVADWTQPNTNLERVAVHASGTGFRKFLPITACPA